MTVMNHLGHRSCAQIDFFMRRFGSTDVNIKFTVTFRLALGNPLQQIPAPTIHIFWWN